MSHERSHPNTPWVTESPTQTEQEIPIVRVAACLVVIFGGQLGRRYVLGNKMRIGRGPDAEVQLDEVSVSRHHAQIDKRKGAHFLVDSGSTNGTSLNGEQVAEPRMLEDGDVIKVGAAVLKYIEHNSVEADYHEEIFKQSTRDRLTGLANRHYFEQFLSREVSRARRHQRVLSLIMMDIDYFKDLNDQYGHTAGDAVLSQLGELILSLVSREEDLAARFGGEEFAVILPEIDDNEAMQFAERIRSAIDNTVFTHSDQKLRLSASFGVATLPPASDARELVELADRALYLGKREGRNTVRLAPERED